LFLAALSLVMFFMLVEFGDRIDFTAKEIEGTRYLRPLITLHRDAGEARRLARVFARGGKSGRPELNRKLEAIHADRIADDAVDKEVGESMESTYKLATLKDDWKFLRKEAAEPEAKHVDKLFADLLKSIRFLYSKVGDNSNLILDPDLDTYYLMDSI